MKVKVCITFWSIESRIRISFTFLQYVFFLHTVGKKCMRNISGSETSSGGKNKISPHFHSFILLNKWSQGYKVHLICNDLNRPYSWSHWFPGKPGTLPWSPWRIPRGYEKLSWFSSSSNVCLFFVYPLLIELKGCQLRFHFGGSLMSWVIFGYSVFT